MNTFTVNSAIARHANGQTGYLLPITHLSYSRSPEGGAKPLQMTTDPSKWIEFCDAFGGLDEVADTLFDLVVVDSDGIEHTIRQFRLNSMPIGNPIKGSFLSVTTKVTN